MPKPATRPAFTLLEAQLLQRMLALQVARMGGRKLEEADWSDAYCAVKGIPSSTWSNLNIDVMHGELGVEHKMLCYRSKPLDETFGSTLMHPSATRSIRIPRNITDANEMMTDILGQYGDLIESRRAQVEAQNDTGLPVDLRTGWLLWQTSLRQFLYFEEEMLPPDPDEFWAEWHTRGTTDGGGTRKPSRNLWIYEIATGRKRYSVTTEAGAKIQPYFDVPPPSDPNVYLFTVIGEIMDGGLVRMWLVPNNAKELEDRVGTLQTGTLSAWILEHASGLAVAEVSSSEVSDQAVPVVITLDAYEVLSETIQGSCDDVRIRCLLEFS